MVIHYVVSDPEELSIHNRKDRENGESEVVSDPEELSIHNSRLLMPWTWMVVSDPEELSIHNIGLVSLLFSNIRHIFYA